MSKEYVGIVSDSHGRFAALEKMIEQAPPVTAWIHCGDYCEDGDDLAIYADVPVYTVLGNNDFMTETNTPEYREVVIGGMHIWAIHGHQWYGRQRLERLAEFGKQYGASLVVFGHTHCRFYETIHDMPILNPGSIALPRDSRHGTYAVCCIENGVLTDVRMYTLTE